MPIVTVILKRDNPLDLKSICGKLTREAFKPFTASVQRICKVVGTVLDSDAKVLEADLGRRTIRIDATPEQIAILQEAHKGEIQDILGLSGKRIAEPRMRILAHDATESYTAAQVAAKYDFPAGGGEGQTVAVIELCDWYDGILPEGVTGVLVGAAKKTSTPTDADGEVALDVAVIQGAAPKAKVVVYFAGNTDQDFYNAISTAAHADPKPCAISISWGGPEDSWGNQTMTTFDDVLQSCVALGIVVTVAAGDSGSGDGESGKHVDFPRPVRTPWPVEGHAWQLPRLCGTTGRKAVLRAAASQVSSRSRPIRSTPTHTRPAAFRMFLGMRTQTPAMR